MEGSFRPEDTRRTHTRSRSHWRLSGTRPRGTAGPADKARRARTTRSPVGPCTPARRFGSCKGRCCRRRPRRTRKGRRLRRCPRTPDTCRASSRLRWKVEPFLLPTRRSRIRRNRTHRVDSWWRRGHTKDKRRRTFLPPHSRHRRHRWARTGIRTGGTSGQEGSRGTHRCRFHRRNRLLQSSRTPWRDRRPPASSKGAWRTHSRSLPRCDRSRSRCSSRPAGRGFRASTRHTPRESGSSPPNRPGYSHRPSRKRPTDSSLPAGKGRPAQSMRIGWPHPRCNRPWWCAGRTRWRRYTQGASRSPKRSCCPWGCSQRRRAPAAPARLSFSWETSGDPPGRCRHCAALFASWGWLERGARCGPPPEPGLT